MTNNTIDASGNRITTNPHNSDSDEEKDMGWNDPAHCNGHRTPTCICRGPPAAITHDGMAERDLDWILEQHEDDISLRAAWEYPGYELCDFKDGNREVQSQYVDYELKTEITPYTNPETGEQYALYQMSLLGVNRVRGEESRETLIIGEHCSTPGGAVMSIYSMLIWFGNYGHEDKVRRDEDVVDEDDCESVQITVGEKPVKAEIYSWKKCSICYNLRDPDPNYVCYCSICEESRQAAQQALQQAFEQ